MLWHALLQAAKMDGFAVQPQVVDAVTHLGAILDTDLVDGASSLAKVPVALGAYKPIPQLQVIASFNFHNFGFKATSIL